MSFQKCRKKEHLWYLSTLSFPTYIGGTKVFVTEQANDNSGDVAPGCADENRSTIFLCDYPVCFDQNCQKVQLQTHSLSQLLFHFTME